MHIIQCADYGGEHRGSFVPMLTAISADAQRRGHPTTLVVPGVVRGRGWVDEFQGLAEVRFVARDGSRRAAIAHEVGILAQTIESGPRPALIHTHFGHYDTLAVLARLRHRDAIVVWHEHGPFRAGSVARLRGAVKYRTIGAGVAAVLPVSDGLRATLVHRGAIPRRTRTFDNAVDTTRFHVFDAAQRSAARTELGLSDDDHVVLHFGWDWERKGGERMLTAAGALGSSARFLTVGAPDAVSARIAAVPSVRRAAPREDVETLYAAADALLVCSNAEGMPLAVLEALACGLPVVASDLPVLRQVLAGLPGAAITSLRPDDIAAGVREVLQLTPDRLRAHREAAVRLIGERYSLASWARRIVDLYETLAASSGSPGRPSATRR